MHQVIHISCATPIGRPVARAWNRKDCMHPGVSRQYTCYEGVEGSLEIATSNKHKSIFVGMKHILIENGMQSENKQVDTASSI